MSKYKRQQSAGRQARIEAHSWTWMHGCSWYWDLGITQENICLRTLAEQKSVREAISPFARTVWSSWAWWTISRSIVTLWSATLPLSGRERDKQGRGERKRGKEMIIQEYGEGSFYIVCAQLFSLSLYLLISPFNDNSSTLSFPIFVISLPYPPPTLSQYLLSYLVRPYDTSLPPNANEAPTGHFIHFGKGDDIRRSSLAEARI